MFKKLIVLSILLLLSLAAVVQFLQAPLNIEEPFILEVKPGQSLSKTDSDLYSQGVLPVPKALNLYMRLNGKAKMIKAGEYRIGVGTSLFALADLLVSGQVIHYQVALIEGLTIKQVIESLNKQEKLISDISLDQVSELMSLIGKSGHPEGMFYPDTYDYIKGTKTSDILKRANKRLDAVLKQEWLNKASGLPYKTAYEALIMASIVEKETGQESEREDISGVFVRRLNKKMRLQTDPTVIYGLQDQYRGNITRKHLRQYTAYNTYRISGLPPTPIALAGRAAINAALHPKKGSALYFVARGDGSHYFSNTLKEHQQAVRKYQIFARKKNYQSAPDNEEK